MQGQQKGENISAAGQGKDSAVAEQKGRKHRAARRAGQAPGQDSTRARRAVRKQQGKVQFTHASVQMQI